MSKKDTNIDFEEVTGAGASAIEGSSIERLQDFFEKNKNAVLMGSAAIILIIGGLFYYKAFHMPKVEMEANNAMFNAQYYFEQDSFDLALNSVDGFLDIADNYGGTKAGNLAEYYAGLSYYNLGNYTDAISHLNSFDSSDPIFGALSIGVLADAQMENGDTDAALSSYKKAANFSMNEAVAPFLLKKAGIAFEMNGDKKQANSFFNKIKKDFPNSSLANDVDKYIGRTSM